MVCPFAQGSQQISLAVDSLLDVYSCCNDGDGVNAPSSPDRSSDTSEAIASKGRITVGLAMCFFSSQGASLPPLAHGPKKGMSAKNQNPSGLVPAVMFAYPYVSTGVFEGHISRGKDHMSFETMRSIRTDHHRAIHTTFLSHNQIVPTNH